MLFLLAMFNFKGKKLLVIAPHPDDEVIGGGGLMQHVKENGGKVYVIYLTVGTTHDFTNGGHKTTKAQQRMAEIKAVAKMYKLNGWRVAFTGDQYHLQLDQIAQRQIVHEIERGEKISLETIKPDILVFPSAADYNQDHRAAAYAALAACRPAPAKEKFIPPLILSAEAPMSAWSTETVNPHPNFIIELTAAQLKTKLKGMNMYKSQVRGKGHPRHTDALRALAGLRGSLIGQPAAEAFYCHKLSVLA